MSEEERVTAIGLFHYAHSYASSASALNQAEVDCTHADSPVRFLYSHAIELYLKSYLRLHGVTVKDLRSRELGHKMDVLRTKAQEKGLAISSIQEGQIDLLSGAIRDRYIETGSRTVILPDAFLELCLYLHGEIGVPVYQDAGVKRALPPLK